jgi:hypothetical protein
MRGTTAKELRRIADFEISYDPAVRNTKEYRLNKMKYKALKKTWKKK